MVLRSHLDIVPIGCLLLGVGILRRDTRAWGKQLLIERRCRLRGGATAEAGPAEAGRGLHAGRPHALREPPWRAPLHAAHLPTTENCLTRRHAISSAIRRFPQQGTRCRARDTILGQHAYAYDFFTSPFTFPFWGSRLLTELTNSTWLGTSTFHVGRQPLLLTMCRFLRSNQHNNKLHVYQLGRACEIK